jgi:uncharacterized membrane-anchored protein
MTILTTLMLEIMLDIISNFINISFNSNFNTIILLISGKVYFILQFIRLVDN